MSPNRIVAVYTPFVFAPLAGFIAAWLAAHVPGVDVASGDLWAVFVAGMLVALAMAAQWVHGWQKWEARHDEQMGLALRLSAVEGAPTAGAVSPALAYTDEADVFDDDLDALDELDGLYDLGDLDEFDDLDEPVEPVLEPGTASVHGGDGPAD